MPPIPHYAKGEAPIMSETVPAYSAPPGRNRSMDIARGFAVMGILLMNIIAFTMPEAAYFNPDAWGGTSLADRIAWALSFILIDGKMRGLFSLLFGASMLMLMDRTEMSGGNGRHRHMIRCAWLLALGITHYLLLWWGDILALYAIVGLVAMLFAGKEPLALVKFAFLAFGIHFLIVTLLMLALYHGQGSVAAPDADASDVRKWTAVLDSIGRPGSDSITDEIALYRGGLQGIVADKASHYVSWAVSGVKYMGLDTLGFMLLGMAMLKGGFLTGKWPRENYAGTARHCFLIGVPPMIALAIWTWASGFDTVTTFGAVFAWSFPFRIPLTVGLAALIFAGIAGRKPGAFLTRVEAAGRMSLSNYLGTSLVMTAVFYGWGLGLFGSVPRAQVYLFVLPVWALMLLWSRPWLMRFRYGPMEWVWRSLTTLRVQPLSRG